MLGDYWKSLLNSEDQTVNGNQIVGYFKNVCEAQRKDKTEIHVKKQHRGFFNNAWEWDSLAYSDKTFALKKSKYSLWSQEDLLQYHLFSS